MPVEDYPTIPEMPAATGTVPSDAFAHAVGQAVTAAGRDDMLPVLTGVRIEIEGDTIALLATDRFRLSQREPDLEPGHPRRHRRRAGAGEGARRHGQVPHRRSRGHHRAVRLRLRRRDHRLRGHRTGRRASYDHATAGRGVPQGPQPVPEREAHGRQDRPRRG
ncbi:hypothetical protein [Nocardioides convexus]|uniref:DNA polymerase III subunit beta family protein n=1 Tax=Nocardioides convexus TaxID=2712224 RepID=UPI0031016126